MPDQAPSKRRHLVLANTSKARPFKAHQALGGNKAVVPVPVPPIDEQLAIVDILAIALEAQARQRDYVETSLKQSAAQRKNILKAAFAGQLVPQDPNDEPANVLLDRIRAEQAGQKANKTPRASRPEAKAEA